MAFNYYKSTSRVYASHWEDICHKNMSQERDIYSLVIDCVKIM